MSKNNAHKKESEHATTNRIYTPNHPQIAIIVWGNSSHYVECSGWEYALSVRLNLNGLNGWLWRCESRVDSNPIQKAITIFYHQYHTLCSNSIAKRRKYHLIKFYYVSFSYYKSQEICPKTSENIFEKPEMFI